MSSKLGRNPFNKSAAALLVQTEKAALDAADAARTRKPASSAASSLKDEPLHDERRDESWDGSWKDSLEDLSGVNRSFLGWAIEFFVVEIPARTCVLGLRALLLMHARLAPKS